MLLRITVAGMPDILAIAVAIHGVCTDVLDARKQRLAAVLANHIAEQLAQESYVRILGNRALQDGLRRRAKRGRHGTASGRWE